MGTQEDVQSVAERALKRGSSRGWRSGSSTSLCIFLNVIFHWIKSWLQTFWMEMVYYYSNLRCCLTQYT